MKPTMLLLLGAWVLPAPALGQSGFDEFLVASPAVSRSEAATSCLTAPPPLELASARWVGCRVEAMATLGAGGGAEWLTVRYRRTADAPPLGAAEWDEIVVLRRVPGADSIVPVWRITAEREYESLNDVRSAALPEGPLTDVRSCLAGTGGCRHVYLLAIGRELRRVSTPFVGTLESRLPEGDRLHKGMTLQLESLRGTWPVSQPGDPNCCPSRTFDFLLRLRHCQLVLEEATLRGADDEP